MHTGHHIRLETAGDAPALGTIKVAALRLTYRCVMPDTVLARRPAAPARCCWWCWVSVI